MQIRYLKSIVPQGETAQRITALTWSPNNQKLAVASADRVVQLFDETGERKDRFSTKPGDPKAARSYTIVGLAFSPDSTKLAVAQSDNAVFVYRLGLEWGEKKSIVNKFIQTAEITCLAWPREQPNALVFGMADGKVRIGNLKTNKAATLYQTESCVVSLSASHDGNAIISGHLDGSMNRFFFDDGLSGASQGKFTAHRTTPVALAWGESVVAAGGDKVVVFYDSEGRVMQEFDYSRDDDVQDFTGAEFSPSGQSVVIGSFNRFYVYNFSTANQQWEEAPVKVIENFYTVSALSWKPDGSRLVAGNMCGAVELFDCCLRRSRYKGKFEFTYVSPSQVIVKRLSTGSRIVLKSHYGYEIQKVNIFRDQYLIANTPDTLLMGDLSTCKLSEIPWQGTGQEKFYFENPFVCMVFNAGELSLVEYGVNELLGSCRTEHTSPHLISVRVNERKNDEDVKRVAYLVDLQSINILDLNTSTTVAAISHDSRIDWLELSGQANKLLFRDKNRQLHMYDIATQTRTTLLNFCSYVQWVPNSDVVVAQNRGNLCIWYSIDSPERVTMFPIKGEVEDIERSDGKTEVIVDEGVNTVSYTLDEGLIEFGTAIDDKDYDRAVALLETLEITPETEAMWKSLSQMALKDQNLIIAERCYAALGDVARTRYLHEVNEQAAAVAAENHLEATEHYSVRAKLAILDKQFKVAESIYLDQGKVEEAMSMYQELHKWNLSIKVAESKNHPDLDTLKAKYFQWLNDSGQEDKAGAMREEEGDFVSAVNLYMKGGQPARAAKALLAHRLTDRTELMERVAAALYKQGLYEKAGELFEKMSSPDRALEAYRRGKAFRAAVELARQTFPQEVIKLEEQWGDQLVSQKQMDGAINHYIEAGRSFKAIEAAIGAKQWKKAVGIVDSLQPPEAGKVYYQRLAAHFSEVGEYNQAEKYFVMAGQPQDAVEMYTKVGKWDAAHTLATTYMAPDEVAVLYISQAKDMEAQGKLKDAEKLYLTVQEPDLAINMYKNHKQYDNMIRLVTAFHKDLLAETHVYLGKSLESDGNFKQAEHHYIEGADWKSAINMYCANNMYEDAYRIAKSYGGPNSYKQVAYLWARSLGGESAVKLLSKFNLLDSAIDFATENGAFDFAFELSRYGEDKAKVADVHYKQAMYLEDEGKFKEAEQAFVLAGKPKEAILMYIHNEDWDAATAVAEAHDPGSLSDVLIGQARVAFERKDYTKGESMLLRAQRPELAIKYYKEGNMWKEAMRFATEYLPNKMSELNVEYDRFTSGQGDKGREDIVSTAKLLEQQQEYGRAIDMYLKITPNQATDASQLQQVWEKAVELAMKFVPDRGPEVVETVCSRLMEVNSFEAAADLFAGMEMYKDAIDAYILGAAWDKAKQMLAYAPKYTEYVESAYVTHLKSTGDAEDLVNVDVVAGLDLFAQRGQWDQCLQKASSQGSAVLNKYLMSFSISMLREGKFDQAVTKLTEYGVPPVPDNFDLYMRLARETLGKGSIEEISALREMLFKLVHGQNHVPQPGVPAEFDRLLFVAHLVTLKNYCKRKKDLSYFAAKQAIATLRYTKELRPDQMFYEAGEAAKAANMNNMAFVCWNRYLDLSEAIEDQDVSLLDNTDFENTDIPFDISLPTENLSDAKREEVRDWVLQMSLDQKVNQEMDRRDCDTCGTKIYDASLNCYSCHTTWEPCVVTGYPVLRSKLKCSSCTRPANKEDWNKFVMAERMCPWCGTSQSPQYFAH
ncbi:uncharacterized protein EV422DRAFT_125936 [Fimicolochytrium jonesii]|uniref:uncharacterized protein n=1 Tax=Fimicolochytrium jonesii TaxID=1396493 RepID=UPI0022FDEB78|nr:uncharacterized protein EV422DRAFT_125936 [Fimicolochytrium jonesii]KAI8818942.1 hypothetical protein EV422DRAFT_125936 [Fimicolochytrium jonesii]